MKRIMVCFLLVLLCFTSIACDNRKKDISTDPDEDGAILSMPELTRIGNYNIEGVSLIPMKNKNTYMLNICLKSGTAFDYKDTAISIKINGSEITMEQLINNSSWALYSVSDVIGAAEIKIIIKDSSDTAEGTVVLDQSRYELYKSAVLTPVYGISANAYSLSENGNLIFLNFTNTSTNAFVDYFIRNYDLVSTGAKMFYLDENGTETEVTEMGGMVDLHPFTGIKSSYLILRPGKVSDVVKIRVKSIYINKDNLSDKRIKEFDGILADGSADVQVMNDENSYTVIFKVPLDIPVIL